MLGGVPMPKVKYKYKWVILGMAVVNLLVVLGVLVFRLPSYVPIHLDNTLTVDAMGSSWAVLLPFAIVPIIFCLVSILSKDNSRDPKVQASYRTRDVVLAVFDVIFIYFGWLMIIVADTGGQLEQTVNLSPMLLIMLPIGLLVYIIAGYLPTLDVEKSRGIRFSWTDGNPKVWQRTQWVATISGIVAGGLIYFLSIIGNFIGVELLGYVGAIVSIIVLCLVVVLYSYLYYQKTVVSRESISHVNRRLEIAQTKLDNLDAVIDTQETLAQDADDASTIANTSTQSVNTLPTEQVIDSNGIANVRDTADVVKEQKKLAKKSNTAKKISTPQKVTSKTSVKTITKTGTMVKKDKE